MNSQLHSEFPADQVQQADEAQQKVFIILNPVAGNSDTEQVPLALERAFSNSGKSFDIYETTGQDDFAEIVRRARDQGYGVIVAAGGDGTVYQVGSELVGSDLTLGILPVGTGNMLARDLSIPLELEDACQLIADAPAKRSIDAMQVDDRVFFTRLSLGMYSRITEKTPASAKRIFRRLAYIFYALPELFGIRTWRFRLTVDGETHRVKASFIFIANVGQAGVEGLSWGRHIRLDDGVIDICIMRGRTFWHYLQFAWYFLRNRHREFEWVNYLKARQHIRITAPERVPIRGDGEQLNVQPLEIKILPGAVNVIAR